MHVEVRPFVFSPSLAGKVPLVAVTGASAKWNGLVSVLVSLAAPMVQFMSDGPGPADPSLAGVCTLNASNCIPENGAPQDVPGTIKWWSGPNGTGTLLRTDEVEIASDVSEVPEPSSLMLFGSGLAIAGGFLRRRRRLVTPSA